MIAQKAAGVTSAQADASRAKADFDRYNALAGQGWVSQQKVQTTKAAATQTAAGVASAQAALEAEKRAAESLGSAKAQAVAQAAAAHAAVEQAKLDLERAVIRAPVAGVVGARSVRPGQLVQPGVALMSVVPLGQAYVVANFKETQVARLRIGQPVEIKADAFGKQKIVGKVGSTASHRPTGPGVRVDPGGECGRQLHQDHPAPACENRRRPQPVAGAGAASRPVGRGQGRLFATASPARRSPKAAQVPPQMARRGAAR